MAVRGATSVCPACSAAVYSAEQKGGVGHFQLAPVLLLGVLLLLLSLCLSLRLPAPITADPTSPEAALK